MQHVIIVLETNLEVVEGCLRPGPHQVGRTDGVVPAHDQQGRHGNFLLWRPVLAEV